MRIILVGPAQARKELKAALAAQGTARIEIAAEFETLHEAHAADIHAHAILSIEAAAGGGSLDRADRWIEEDLTPREIEVLELLAEGLPNKRSASDLASAIRRSRFTSPRSARSWTCPTGRQRFAVRCAAVYRSLTSLTIPSLKGSATRTAASTSARALLSARADWC